MKSPVARIIGLAALCLSLVGVGSQKTQKITVEIFAFSNVAPHAYLDQAIITVAYAGVAQTQIVDGPNPHARFVLPAVQCADVMVDAEGFCTVQTTVTFSRASYVGGHAIWLGLDPCGTVSWPAAH
jgi:hypothetical protein